MKKIWKLLNWFFDLKNTLIRNDKSCYTIAGAALSTGISENIIYDAIRDKELCAQRVEAHVTYHLITDRNLAIWLKKRKETEKCINILDLNCY